MARVPSDLMSLRFQLAFGLWSITITSDFRVCIYTCALANIFPYSILITPYSFFMAERIPSRAPILPYDHGYVETSDVALTGTPPSPLVNTHEGSMASRYS